MLRKFKSKLIHLSEENRDFFIQKIQERIPSEESITIAISLRSFVLTMPDLIIQIHRWMKDPGCPTQIKKLVGFLFTYIYHPFDFIPEERQGLFGYLDDAYLAGRIFILTMNFTDYNSRYFLPNMKNLETDIPDWIKMTRSVIPEETDKIDQMLKDLLEGRTDSFDRLMAYQK